jgi:hypothetical protein
MLKKSRANLIDSQFDQYSRQSIAYSIIKEAFGSKRINILDIGGHLGRTNEYFNKDNVVIIDVYDKNYEGYVKGNALNLPFEDSSFDVVVSFDVLEHIAKKDRKKFIDEACRVSKDALLIAAPFDTELVAETENQVNKLYKKIYKINHPWLIEHLDNGLPDLEKTQSYISKNKMELQIFSSNNIFLWKLMMSFLFLCGNSRLSNLELKINNFYNKNSLYLGDNTEPSYRKIIFARKSEKLLARTQDSKLSNNEYNQLLDLLIDGITDIISDKALSMNELSSHELKKVIEQYESRLSKLNQALEHKKKHPFRNMIAYFKNK